MRILLEGRRTWASVVTKLLRLPMESFCRHPGIPLLGAGFLERLLCHVHGFFFDNCYYDYKLNYRCQGGFG